ncbi:hypothetical protein APHAL10511_003014 [Amanita phalloides]|nr:hypothetical protein APHAL10511_003014 [Amanita phalloides]
MLDEAYKREVRRLVRNFLQNCGVPVIREKFDFSELSAATYKMLWQDFGYPLDDVTVSRRFKPYLEFAVVGVGLSYPHIKDVATRSLIAAHAAMFLNIDDFFSDKPGVVEEFNTRFVNGRPQEHPLLETFARLLRCVPKGRDPVLADMIIQSSMAFITSLAIEYHLKHVNLSHGIQLANPLRIMSGLSAAYILFVFPPNSSPQTYLSLLPLMIDFVNLSNDVLSFYKEELAGETTNHISIRARTNGTDKLCELGKAIDESINAYQQFKDIYPECWTGYLRYHIQVPRYKLLELLELA